MASGTEWDVAVTRPSPRSLRPSRNVQELQPEDALIGTTRLTLAAAGLISSPACMSGHSKGADSGAASPAPANSGGVDLTGAGATLPHPIYSNWSSDYAAKTAVK